MAIITEQQFDYASSSIPLSERRGPLTMGLLWISMVTGFPSVLIGFEWFKDGFTLKQILSCTALGCLLLLIYSVPATQLGARSGLGFAAMSRNIFGRWGSGLISINLILVFTAFYGFLSLLMAECLVGLYHWPIPVAALSFIAAILMSANNFFGFKGVANFARYIAAPVIIIWIGHTFFKAFFQLPPSAFSQIPRVPFTTAMTAITGFTVGLAIWGNEMDYWRYSRPKAVNAAIPLVFAWLIGQIVFPVTGWMVARITGVTEYGAATALMDRYSFGGIALLTALVLGVSYFAANDSNLFGSVQGFENLKKLPHRRWSIIVAVTGGFAAMLLSIFGAQKSLEPLLALNCVIMPTPTVIMMAEWLLMARVFKKQTIDSLKVPSFEEIPAVRWPAVISLFAGFAVGIGTSGVIPGAEKFAVGISSLQAWITAFVIYMPLRLIEYQREAKLNSKLERMLELATNADPNT